jgi:antitoxin (DNA-binding transcriptional repressor) of toxin-antitoxin stability system
MRTRRSVVVTVKITELKNRLSHYLRRVQRGDSILVCDRDRAIARIERAGAPLHVLETTPRGWIASSGAARSVAVPAPFLKNGSPRGPGSGRMWSQHFSRTAKRDAENPASDHQSMKRMSEP